MTTTEALKYPTRHRAEVTSGIRQHYVTAGNPTALEENALREYARRLNAPGGLRGGITYSRSHRLDAERNLDHTKITLSMPIMTVAGEASAGGELEEWIAPVVDHQRYEIIQDCGQYLAEEQAERLTELLLDFLGDGDQA